MKLMAVNYNPKAGFLVEALHSWLDQRGVEFDEAQGASQEQIVKRGSDVDILLVTPKTEVSAPMLGQLPNLKLLLAWGNGYEQIDIQAANERGIVVCNAGAYSNPDVAEMALTLIFACARKLLQHNRLLYDGRWSDRLDLQPIFQLKGRLVGLLGFGKIARELCWRLKGIQMEVQAADPFVNGQEMSSYGVRKVDEEELFRSSDFISLHLRVNEETRNIIGERNLRLMKKTAFLINVSRGALVDESALAAALREGWIAGAGLDVLKHEPPSEDDPLLHLPNITLSPHVGAGTESSKREHVQEWSRVVRDLMEGKHPLHNQVNPQIKPKAPRS